MKLKFFVRGTRSYAVVVLLSVSISLLAQSAISGSVASRPSKDSKAEIWLKRKAEFYRNTSFELSPQHLALFGGKFSQYRSGHLPFWFDFELFKEVFNKQYANAAEDLDRHRTYIKTCVRTLKARVLFRILAGTKDEFINKDADMFYKERIALATQSSSEFERPADKISFSVALEAELMSGDDSPVEWAKRLVREELAKVESRNQLLNYLKAFDEVDGSAIRGPLPY